MEQPIALEVEGVQVPLPVIPRHIPGEGLEERVARLLPEVYLEPILEGPVEARQLLPALQVPAPSGILPLNVPLSDAVAPSTIDSARIQGHAGTHVSEWIRTFNDIPIRVFGSDDLLLGALFGAAVYVGIKAKDVLL